jgi:hypothetical protein
MKPTPDNPYPSELDKLARCLTILQRKSAACAEFGDMMRAAAMKEAQLEVQNLCLTEFGYTRADLIRANKAMKGL